MRFLFFLIVGFIAYFFIKYIFKGLFSSNANKNATESRSAKSKIDDKDIIEAEFEEIVDTEKTEDEGKDS